MTAHLRANLWLLGLTVLICCVLYPLTLWTIGQACFPEQAAGSLIVEDGKVIGSRLIAQPFTQPEYFWPRPSAVAYDASASGGSNLSANNPKLRNRVVQTLAALKKYPSDPQKEVPADLVMASGSGLDPHITLKNADYQLDRVVAAWTQKTGADAAEVRDTVKGILEQNAIAPCGGMFGEPIVNVLEINLALRKSFAGRHVFHHPAIPGRHYLLDKLTAFHRDQDTPMPQVLRDLQAALAHVPAAEQAAEAKPLHEELQRIQEGRRRGPQPLADILPLVLARLGVGVVQSEESGE